MGNWWTANGFNQTNGSGGDGAAYLNRGELGMGRDVGCKASSGDFACWATHYGNPDNNPSNADYAAQKIGVFASYTLTMELQAAEGFVKVFAYQGSHANAPRISSVDLDGSGPKNLPRVCTHCHGAGYHGFFGALTVADAVPGGAADLKFSFREFNVASSGPPTGVDLEPAFKTLNQLVAQGNPIYATSAGEIGELITGWYAGPNPNKQDQAFVPSAWNDTVPHQSLYLAVVSKSCRNCHAALHGLEWNTFPKFQYGNDFEGMHSWV